MLDNIILILLFILPFLAYRYRSNYAVSLLLLLVLGFVLRGYVMTDIFLHGWDERHHALVAKNLLSNPLVPTLYIDPVIPYDYKDWACNHIWLHKPPLTLWSIAGALKLFGIHEWNVRMPSLLFSTLSILLTAGMARRLLGKEIGLWVAFLQVISGFLIDLAGGRIATDHVDTLFLFLVELGAFLIIFGDTQNQQKRLLYLTAIGLVTGLSILCKWLTGYFIVILFLLYELLVLRKKWAGSIFRSGVIFLVGTLVALPWYFYTYQHFPNEFLWEQLYNIRHLSEDLEGHGKPWYFLLNNARINWNETIYAVFLYVLYWAVKERDLRKMFVLLWIGIPYLIFSFASSKMTGYVVICAPAIFIMLSIWVMEFWNRRAFYYRLLAVLPLIFAIRYGVERVKLFQNHPAKEAHKKEQVFTLVNQLDFHKKNVVFGYLGALEMMFYTDVICYDKLPTEEQISAIDLSVYQITCVDYKEVGIPDYIRANPKINIIKLERL